MLDLPTFEGCAFYYCPFLGCGLYYANPKFNYRPILKATVIIPRLDNEEVDIEYVGKDYAGYWRLLAKNVGNRIFPVNLFNRPWQIDPFLSRTVSNAMMDEWESVLAEFRADERYGTVIG